MKIESSIRLKNIFSTIVLGFFLGALLGGVGGYMGCGCVDLRNIIKGSVVFGFVAICLTVVIKFAKVP